MKFTTNLNLKKPDYTDPVDIGDINGNMDIVDSAIQSKVDNIRVLTDVPLNAKFTDTIVDISGKADKSQVLTNVPSGAKFTDTTYTAGAGLTLTGTVFTPTFGTTAETVTQGNDSRLSNARTPLAHNQAISTITGLEDALDGKVNNSQVLTDVPSGAKFTDTITTINNKTGTITKEDIVALGIPASDTDTTYTEITTAEIDAGTASTLRTITGRRLKYLLDKIVALFPTKTSELTNDSGFLTSVTKSDVGLSNVDDVKQMPIAGGTFTGISKAQNNTSHTVAQIRNVILSTSDANASSMGEGDIWIKYK